jgi:hypothetical protein
VSGNSRAKDIFDLVNLIPRCDDNALLKQAINQTFSNQETPLPNSFWAFVNEIRPDVLRTAWGAILITGEKTSFDEAWRLLINLMKHIGEMLHIMRPAKPSLLALMKTSPSPKGISWCLCLAPINLNSNAGEPNWLSFH